MHASDIRPDANDVAPEPQYCPYASTLCLRSGAMCGSAQTTLRCARYATNTFRGDTVSAALSFKF